MEKNRKRALRRHHARRVFKARLIKYAAVCVSYPKVCWKELYNEHWAQLYRTSGTLCSCWMCRGESYNRLQTRKEADRIIREAFDDMGQE